METKQAMTIRRRLAEAGIPEKALARRVGISHVYLHDILAGHRQGKNQQAKLEAAFAALLSERAATKPARRDLQDELHALAAQASAQATKTTVVAAETAEA